MTNGEILLRKIFGPVRSDIRPLILAVDITSDLLFTQRISMDDIHVTDYVYTDVAKALNKTLDAASRSIVRLTHLCWDTLVKQDSVAFYLGCAEKQFPSPHDLLVYLAVYSSLHMPFFVLIEKFPQFLFQTTLFPFKMFPTLDERITKAIQRSTPVSVTQARTVTTSSGWTSFPVCPTCSVTLEREWQNFCDRCGQCLDWKQYRLACMIYPQ